MPFLLRQSDYPTLAAITSIPQIVIIDKTGPTLSLGVGNKAVCIVGEFIKGPFTPTEVTSAADLQSQFGGLLSAAGRTLLSQSAISGGVQDGTGIGWGGNGIAQLKARQFRRLVIQRVNMDAVTTSGGTTGSTVGFTVTGTPSPTTQDIVIPAGTCLADNTTYANATNILATSKDVTIPKGTTLPSVVTGVPAFFVRGTTIAAAGLTNILDAVIPSAPTTTSLSTPTNPANMFPPGSGGNLIALIQSNYAAAIDKTLPTDSPMIDINAIWVARNDSVTRPYLVSHAVTASQSGPGRVAIVSASVAPTPDVTGASTAKTAAIALASTESYAQPADRAIICFPHVKIFSSELGTNITVSASGYMASIISNRPEEENPGAANSALTSTIQGYEDAFAASPLVKQDYINLKAGGVSAMQKDRSVGWWFVDGVTAADTTLFPTRSPIKRRRMADMIQDTIAQLAVNYQKKPATIDRVDAFVGEIKNFLELLKSNNNPSLQRIVDYVVDPKSRNNPTLQKLGIQTILVVVQLLAGMDDIVIESIIGETVDINNPSS